MAVLAPQTVQTYQFLRTWPILLQKFPNLFWMYGARMGKPWAIAILLHKRMLCILATAWFRKYVLYAHLCTVQILTFHTYSLTQL